jgi:hypothetical protein
MKQIHATTRSWTTYFRMIGLLAASFFAIFCLPTFTHTETYDTFLQTHLFNAGLVYAILIGFLLYATMTRKQNLEEAVSLELNKSRRIYHLARNIYAIEPRLKSWFTTVEKALDAYHRQFARSMDFSQYEKGDALFRHVTYTVYKLPQLGVPYEPELYASLLDACASATEARESINAFKDNTIGRFSWFVMVLITALFALIIVLYTPFVLIEQLLSVAMIFSLFLSVQLIYEYDRGNRLRHRFIGDLYLENMKRAKKSLK